MFHCMLLIFFGIYCSTVHLNKHAYVAISAVSRVHKP